MNNAVNEQAKNACPRQAGMVLTPLEQCSAWDIIKNNNHVMSMGKYFYIGIRAD